ncbi:MAG: hypothetical protein GC181_11645 [Bacteroidetes bacterium]|nr:hypothetical protein [Bacteroidota bacterium]
MRFRLAVLLLCVFLISKAQDSTVVATVQDSVVEELDSVELRYGVKMYATLEELADSVFEKLKTKKFDDLLPFIATANMLSEEFDSLDMGYLQRLSVIKAQYMVNSLRKDHLKMLRYAKKFHLNFREMYLIGHRYREREKDGHIYGEITYECESGRHKFYITFFALKLVDHWFLADDLKAEEIIDPMKSRGR